MNKRKIDIDRSLEFDNTSKEKMREFRDEVINIIHSLYLDPGMLNSAKKEKLTSMIENITSFYFAMGRFAIVSDINKKLIKKNERIIKNVMKRQKRMK